MDIITTRRTKVEKGYELLADIVVRDNPVTNVDITGLNIGKGDEVVLVTNIPNPGDVAFSIYANGNTTATNYYYQRLTADGTAVAGSRYNSAILMDSINAFGIARIKLTNSGYFVWQTSEARNIGSSGIRLWNGYGTSTFTSTAITQLTITAGASNGIVVGSRFQLYKIGGA